MKKVKYYINWGRLGLLTSVAVVAIIAYGIATQCPQSDGSFVYTYCGIKK